MKANIFSKVFLSSLLALLFLSAFPVFAATSDTSIVIQPSRVEVTAAPGQKLARSFSVINRSNFNVRFKVIVKDYKQVSDNGQIQFYDSKTNPASDWLVAQYLEISLKPLETKDVGFVANVPKNFPSGGYYGAILFQPETSNVNVPAGGFGEQVLLTVADNSSKASAVVQAINFSTGAFQGGNPVNFSLKMQNTGNTHFDSQGQLVLKNWLGKTIGNYSVGQLIVYPKTSRNFKWQWNGTPSIGLFQAEFLVADSAVSQNFKLVSSAWFIIFPWPIALALLAVALAIFLAFKYREVIFSRKTYKKSIPVLIRKSVYRMDK